jgi:hypothetical protein
VFLLDAGLHARVRQPRADRVPASITRKPYQQLQARRRRAWHDQVWSRHNHTAPWRGEKTYALHPRDVEDYPGAKHATTDYAVLEAVGAR